MKKKNIFFIFVLCLLISFIFTLPHLVGFKRFGQNYTPLCIKNCDSVTIEETYTYAPRVEELHEKNQKFVHDPYTFENKDKASPFFGETIPSYIMLIFTKIFGDVSSSFIAADFIFPVLIFLMIFIFIFKTSNSFLYGVAGALTVIFLRDLFLMFPYPMKILDYLLQKDAPVELLSYSRAFHPQISFPIFLSFIILVYLCIQTQKKKYVIISGLILGSLFYTYLFYWSVSLMSTVILFAYYMRSNQKIAKRILYVLIISGFVGLPYFVNMMLFRKSPDSLSFLEMSSYSHATVLFMPVLRFLVILLLITIFKKSKNRLDYVFFAFTLSAILLPNIMNAVFGRNLEGIHYVRRVLLPITTIYLFILFSKFRPVIAKIALIVLIQIAFIFGLSTQIKSIHKTGNNYSFDKENRDLMNFLKKDIPKISVIGSASQEINLWLPAVSSHYVFLPRSNMTISSSDEILSRYFILSQILGRTKQETISELKENLGFYIFYFPWIENDGARKEQLIKKTLNRLEKFQFEKEIGKYKLDYILVQKSNNIKKRNGHLNWREPLFKNNKYEIYKF